MLSCQLPALVVTYDVGIVYRKAYVYQVSPDGFGASIALLHSADQHLTMWLLLVGLYSGSPEISFILML